MSYSGSEFFIAVMLVHFTPLYLILGPLFYFYVRGLINDDHKLYKLDYLHFIPAVLFFINITPYIFTNWENKLHYAAGVIENPRNFLNVNYLFLSPNLSFLSRPVFALLYVLYSVIMIIKRGLNKTENSIQSKLIYRWMYFLVFIAILLYGSFLTFTVNAYFSYSTTFVRTDGIFIFYITLIGLLLLNISLLFFPNILYGLPQFDYAIKLNKSNKISFEEATDGMSVKKQGRGFEISDEKLELLHAKISKYIINKPYLNPEFNLTLMSVETDIPVHHLSYYFNEYMGISFNTWKNDLKIAYVIELIQSGSGELLTLDALAKQAGFGSRTTFFNTFKQKTGFTPSDYLNSLD